MTNTIEDILAHLEETIERNKQSLRELLDLQSRMNTESFDEEDRTWVKAEIRGLRTKTKYLISALESKKHLYDNTIQDLQKTLVERQVILEDADKETGVLGDHPALLQKFAAKQADLHQMFMHLEEELKQDVD